ncbi:phosphotransferase family protein [Candidatus Leptofilum sp.]|uniref:phosphotransferase family protein n=1 Tax=Candidatus Leptofilum sp. TaxID=3241576 RepID=UPI003B5931E9
MTAKPNIDKSQIQALVRSCFDEPIDDLAPLGTGQIALVYSFRAGDQEFVIRFVESKMAHTLKKEVAVANLLQGSEVLLPPILHQGPFEAFYFAIALRAAGQPLDELNTEQYKLVLPDLIKMLDTIHQADLGNTQGYGFFDETAVGQSASWPDFLLKVGQEEEDGFYGHWHHLFEDSFLERPLFDQLYAEMQRLFSYLPTERWLVHGDYGYNNVLAEGEKVTAVLDWANAKFGDFLFDVAYLTTSATIDYVAAFQQFYRTHNREVPHFLERIRCYQCYISLDGLRFFAKTDSRDGYEWIKRGIAKNLGFGT